MFGQVSTFSHGWTLRRHRQQTDVVLGIFEVEVIAVTSATAIRTLASKRLRHHSEVLLRYPQPSPDNAMVASCSGITRPNEEGQVGAGSLPSCQKFVHRHRPD
jgi:hypothetical protein